MSSVYVLEPPTRGKVVLHTTMGPLDIELWPKEAPKAARNFVQLCMEGYYDETIFHRVIKGFLVQGGDPTGSGTGGESIFGSPFADEFHSRLRFNHRGLVACANAGAPNSNGSQFFITLDRCDWLDKKNTIFGKVTGDTIYNLLRLGDVETSKDDRPVDPQKILSVEILWDPFDDIIPRKKSKVSNAEVHDEGTRKKNAVRQLNILSFRDEVEDEMQEDVVKDKIKSIHDVLDDPRFIKEESEQAIPETDQESTRNAILSVREALASKKNELGDTELDSDPNYHSDDDEMSFDARMRSQILQKRKDFGDVRPNKNLVAEKSDGRADDMSDLRNSSKDTNHNANAGKLSLKKRGIGSEARAERAVASDADLQLLGQAGQERELQKRKKRQLQGRESETLEKLQKFKSSFLTKATSDRSIESKGNDDDDDDDDDDDLSGWKSNILKFPKESSEKDGMARRDNPDDYTVIDPLLEKGKEKFNKAQAKMKRRQREWAGKSLT